MALTCLDCARPLAVSPVPVEYETILRGMFSFSEEPLQAGAPPTLVPVPDTAVLRAATRRALLGLPPLRSSGAASDACDSGRGDGDTPAAPGGETGEPATTAPSTTPPSPSALPRCSVPLRAFREAMARGDAVGFALLVATAASENANVDAPLCDDCMSAALRRQEAALGEVLATRDAAAFLTRDLRRRVARAREAHGCVASAGMPTAWAETARVLQSRLDAVASAAAAAGVTVAAAPPAPPAQPLSPRAAHTARLLALRKAAAANKAALESASTLRQTALTRAVSRCTSLAALRDRAVAIEQRGWADARSLSRALAGVREAMFAARARNLRLRHLLGRLRYLSVHNDAYFVWHRGPFGTLNGCRLGSLPGQPVETVELDAALGHAAALVHAITTKLDVVLTRYRVVPRGSFSVVSVVGSERTHYGLYKDSRKVNAALKALLSCVAELGDRAQAVDRAFRLPYAITHGGERIGDLRTMLSAKDAEWTRAMKLLLIDLKWLLAWATRQAGEPLTLAGGQLR